MRQKKKRDSQSGAVRDRIRELFLANLGRVVSREEIIHAARGDDPSRDVENWHQRLSELRTDEGYTILTNRDRPTLRPGQYLMESAKKRPVKRRVYDTSKKALLLAADPVCAWPDCGLREGQQDPIGGGTVRLQLDHVRPHAMEGSEAEEQWQLLCGRHQVMKKNFWDDSTGKLNIIAILQAASLKEKQAAYDFLAQVLGKQEP